MSEPETNAAEDLAGLLFDYFASGHSEGCRVDWEDVDQNELQESAKAEAEEFFHAQKPSEPVLFVLKYMGEYLHPESMSFVSAEEAWAHVKDPGSGLYKPWKEGESLDDWKVIPLLAAEADE